MIKERMQPTRTSVIIPAYNCARYIKQTLASVIAQERPNLEIIVVDDGSTDDTVRVVEDFVADVTLISQQNAGVSAARNTGLQHATGEYVAFLDADDWFYPSKLYKQAQLLDRDSGLGAVHGGWNIVDKDNRVLSKIEPWHNAPKLDLRTWLVWKPVQLGAMLFRREWLSRVDGFDEDLRQSEDTDLMFRLALEGCRFEWSREAASGYRQHSESTMRSRALEQADCLERSLDNVYSDERLPNGIRRREASIRYYSTLWLAWNLFRTGHASESVPYLLRASRHSPFESKCMLQDWLAQFVVWSKADGMSAESVREMWPWFRLGARIDEEDWEAEIDRLDVCLRIWSHYVAGNTSKGRDAMKRLKTIDFSQLVATIAFYILFTPLPTNNRAMQELWSDAHDVGLAKSSERHQLTHLYLSNFGRSVRSQEPVEATAALWAAVRFGVKPNAWPAWWDFARGGIRYFSSQVATTPAQYKNQHADTSTKRFAA